MGTGFAFTEGPVWDRSDFLWVSDEKGNRIVKLYPDGRIETTLSVIDPDGSTYDQTASPVEYLERFALRHPAFRGR